MSSPKKLLARLKAPFTRRSKLNVARQTDDTQSLHAFPAHPQTTATSQLAIYSARQTDDVQSSLTLPVQPHTATTSDSAAYSIGQADDAQMPLALPSQPHDTTTLDLAAFSAGQTDEIQSFVLLSAQPHTMTTSVHSPPSTLGTHNATHSVDNAQPSGQPLPAGASTAVVMAVSDTDGHNHGDGLVVDPGEESWLSKGFDIFKSAVQVTKEVSDLFPPLKTAAAGLLAAMERFESVKDVQENFAYAGRKLMSLQDTYGGDRSHLEASESIKASMKSLIQTMGIVEKMAQAKSERGAFMRTLENPSDVKAVGGVLRMVGDVADQLVTRVTVSTHSMVYEGLQRQVLDKLDFAEKALFRSIKNDQLCTDGTRTDFLADLLVWATATDKPHVCWVHGPAGSGKTTIAFTLCSLLRGLGLLGGSFFCSRSSDDKRRSTDFIFSTLARSLAHEDAGYARSLADVLKEPGAGSVTASEQLTSLIAQPIRAAHPNGSPSSGPIRILVIDALDECGDDDQTVYNLILRLLTESRELRLKFLITSRPESHISRAFEKAEQDRFLLRRMQDIPEEAAKVDIKIYLESKLKECAEACRLGNNWPPAVQIDALARQAGTLFIYASTACKYVWSFDDDPKRRLSSLTAVQAEPLRGIDPMYEFVLNKARQSKTNYVWNNTRRCAETIVCMIHPLTLRDMGDLLDIDREDVRNALAGLQAVLRIPSSDDSDVITVFHASFPDYLLDATRSQGKDWFLESAGVHRDLLRRCLSVLRSNLQFNISNSHTSYVSNEKQPVTPVISGALRYSCFHWVDHLEGSGELGVAELAGLSEVFLERYLYWLEVLSITGEVPRAPVVMTRLLNWLNSHADLIGASDEPHRIDDTRTVDDLREFARDAREFVNRFAQPIEESCPHIYLSALAATSRSSTVWTKILWMVKGLPSFMTQQIQDTCPIFVLRGHASNVTSVAFSSDGTRFVSGSNDRTVRLWDAATGAAIGDPLRGHESWVMSVAFSPDGTRIVSGSSDDTVRLWDAATGAAIGDPLRGHNNSVNSVAFSPDGTRVVSGSSDDTVRLWDSATGAAIGDPLRSHEESVNSVTFSPDGTRVVSGSIDRTIRLWDAATGAAIGNPLRGHEDWVNSVAFSPDGTRVVSGADDRTVRLWDAATGAAIGDPIHGHEYSVKSVAFSPDGTRVVSGSSDETVRLWDVATGAAIGDPLRGHEKPVKSVAFSPDGTRVVSGSDDGTVRLWDAAPGAAIGDPLRGHENEVNSVAFSPDGTRVVSGSFDRTIRLWDAATGAAIGDPIRGHEDPVNSVAFSPDGTRVVSGSWDRTVRLWDAATGAAIGDPLRGHEHSVNSVAFLPDGTRVVSGSSDDTVRLWDAATGAAIGNPFRGDERLVNSVAVSPNGTRVVSGSDDGTIQLWDAATGAAIGDPLRGHEYLVNSVGFSPDGTRIVSGSDDGTVRLWDADTGAAIGDPLRGHDDCVNSVAFSPDGTRVVSGSGDRTIRLWDAATGAAIGDPIHGHEYSVTSVAFSPDGTRVVSGSSGSSDSTVRLWDAATGAAIGDPLRGHSGNIDSVAFSPDGMQLVSTSFHGTIRRWDAESLDLVDDAVQNPHHPRDTSADRHGLGAPSAVRLAHATHRVLTSNFLYRVAFSPISAHALSVGAFQSGLNRDPRDIFTLDERGWLLGPNGELFLWILPEYRSGLWWPRTTAIMGTHPVMLDLNRFVHGENWMRCFWSDSVEDDGGRFT